MKYKPDSRGNIGLEGKAPHNLIAFTKCYTGYVGSESTDMLYFPKGDDIDETTRDLAIENAQSHGYEGSYHCNECGDDAEDNVCPECQNDCEWQENDGVQGCATWFMLSYHTARIGGFHWIDLLNVLKEAGACTSRHVPGIGNFHEVKLSMLFGETGLFNDGGKPEAEWAYMVDDAGFDGLNIVAADENKVAPETPNC